MGFQLRPYQQECIEIIDNLPDGKYLVVMATGLGKTTVFTHLKRNGRVLILSHRDELVRQPQRFYDCSFGVEKAEESATDEEVVSASVQSISKDSRLSKYSPDAFDMIIIDEAHHAAAPSYRKVLDYFTGAKKIIGVTATPARNDKVGLDKVFDEIVFVRDLKWGINNGYLCRIRAARVSASYSLKNVKKIAGDFSQADLDKNMGQEVFATAAKVYATECYPKGKHVLVYCTTRDKVQMAVDLFRGVIPKKKANTVRMILGDTPQEERDQILADFRSGKVKVIVNCMVLTEGTDLPICDAIINLRPTANVSLYQQIIGRGTRLSEGKEYVTVYDILPDDESNRRGICTAPTLFGLDPELLDKKQKSKINTENDLMDLCDELTGMCLNMAKLLQIHVEMTEAFLEETEKMQEECKTLKELADRIDHINKEGINGEPGFFGLRVSVQPSKDRKYLIRPTYKSEITLSEPNVLGETNVTMFLEREYFEPFFKNSGLEFAPEMRVAMKFPKAIMLVRSLCAAAPAKFRASWDANARDGYKTRTITSNQNYKINSDYKEIKKKMKPSSLNMYDASNLIDFHNQIEAAKKLVKKYAITDTQKESTKEKRLDAYKEEYGHETAKVLDKKELETLQEIAKKGEKMAASFNGGLDESRINWNKTSILKITVGTSYLYECSSTTRQAGYAKCLIDRLKSKRIYMDKPINFTYEYSYVTATFIDAMIQLEKMNVNPKAEAIVIRIDSVKQLALTALESSKMKSLVTGDVVYTVVLKEEAS